MKGLVNLYSRFAAAASRLQSPLLLIIRVYWGWQLAGNGWSKLHNLSGITTFFASLNIPFPGFNAHFIAGLEFFGGILLILGLGSRFISLLMTGNMLVAYWTADHEALLAVVSDPDKFSAAAPFIFLFTSVIVLIFGPGLFSLDALIAKRSSLTVSEPGSLYRS